MNTIIEAEATGGSLLPYTGYVEARLSIPGIRAMNKNSLFMVVKDTNYTNRVPVQLRTLHINEVLAVVTREEYGNLPVAWARANFPLNPLATLRPLCSTAGICRYCCICHILSNISFLKTPGTFYMNFCLSRFISSLYSIHRLFHMNFCLPRFISNLQLYKGDTPPLLVLCWHIVNLGPFTDSEVGSFLVNA